MFVFPGSLSFQSVEYHIALNGNAQVFDEMYSLYNLLLISLY